MGSIAYAYVGCAHEKSAKSSLLFKLIHLTMCGFDKQEPQQEARSLQSHMGPAPPPHTLLWDGMPSLFLHPTAST